MGKYSGFDIESKKTVGVRLGWAHLYFVGNKLFDLSSSAIEEVDCHFISHFGAAFQGSPFKSAENALQNSSTENPEPV